jgi:hypothetical protein
MRVRIDGITIDSVDRHGHIEAEVDFYDNAEVIQEFGLKECVSALDADDILNEIGWDSVKKYFADEIKELVDEAKTE